MKLVASLVAFAAKHKRTAAVVAVGVVSIPAAAALVAYQRRQERLKREAEDGVTDEEREQVRRLEDARLYH